MGRATRALHGRDSGRRDTKEKESKAGCTTRQPPPRRRRLPPRSDEVRALLSLRALLRVPRKGYCPLGFYYTFGLYHPYTKPSSVLMTGAVPALLCVASPLLFSPGKGYGSGSGSGFGLGPGSGSGSGLGSG